MSRATGTAGTEWRRHWPLVAAATSGMSVVALSPVTFGVMLLPIEQDLGWSRTEIASGPVLVSLMSITLGTLIGAAVDRLGPRLVGSMALTVICAALAMFSLVDGHIWQWWALWALIGMGSAAIPPSTVTPVSHSFSAGRGLAIAVVLSGSGITSFIAPSLTNALVEDYGWRSAYVAVAAIWAVISLPLAVLFLKAPRHPQPAAAHGAEAVPASELPGFTMREAFSSLIFYRLVLAAFLSTFAGSALVLNLVPVLRSTGLTAAGSAAIAGSIGIATIIGRIVGGGFIDRFHAGLIAASVTVGAIVFPAVLLLLPGSAPASLAAVVTYGVMSGAMMPAIAYLASRHFGTRSFGALYATMNAIMSIGFGGGPLLANLIYDRTQSYEMVLWAVIPIFGLGALLFATLGPYRDFSREDTAG